ncbi:MAG: hypothetical protein QOG10_1186 [Kribbellaceae bacterium]|nr:hypothetical protein [Kribbellaceae bacterium]
MRRFTQRPGWPVRGRTYRTRCLPPLEAGHGTSGTAVGARDLILVVEGLSGESCDWFGPGSLRPSWDGEI